MNRLVRLLVGLTISAVCVWISMRDIHVGEVGAALRHANYWGFIGVMAVTLAGFWIRAVRWRSLITAPRRIGTGSLFSATMIGFMANNVLPFRLGEFVRPWALARRESLSKTTLLATVVVERAVDMLTLLAILGMALAVYPLRGDTEAGRMVQAGAGLLLLLSVALTAFVVALERQPRLAHAMIGWTAGFLPASARERVTRALDHFLEGLGLFRDLKRLSWVFFLSFVMFLTFSLGLTISMAALHIQIAWYGGLIMLVITAIGIMVPAAPGYIGTLNLACVAGLALFHVGKEAAVPFSWFYFASQWLPITAVGLWYLNREGLSLRSLGEASR
ncbi:MAG: flippase-like domain-containing protein [Candidatus Eisenbacteria bacterium]|nr:flippase-like domain-containing protein [Candidatus Eisenbacteria bacterium]